jgi:GrpB-like predicted nucleotidyltransferase (UPF0157 family)
MVSDQRVEVVDHDPAWAGRFAGQRVVLEGLPEDPFGHYRLWLLRPRPAARTHHLQVMEGTDPHALTLLAFRDVLRADERLRREYSSLKEQLSEQHRESRNAYTNAKGAFVARVLRQRGISAPERGLLPE